MKYVLAAVELASGLTLAAGMIAVAWRLYREEYHWLYWFAVSFILFVAYLGASMLVGWLLGFPAIHLLHSLGHN
jgi:hypothetical protein